MLTRDLNTEPSGWESDTIPQVLATILKKYDTFVTIAVIKSQN